MTLEKMVIMPGYRADYDYTDLPFLLLLTHVSTERVQLQHNKFRLYGFSDWLDRWFYYNAEYGIQSVNTHLWVWLVIFADLPDYCCRFWWHVLSSIKMQDAVQELMIFYLKMDSVKTL